MSDDEDQPDEVSERLGEGDDDLLALFDSKGVKSTENRPKSQHFDANDNSLEHSVDDRGDFLHRREDNESFDYSVDEDHLSRPNGDVDQSPPLSRQRQFADDDEEDDDEDSRLSLRNIDDVEEPPPLPPPEKRFAFDELPELLKRLKIFADENREKQRRKLSGQTSETIEEARRREEMEAFIKIYKERMDCPDGQTPGDKQRHKHFPKLALPKFYSSLPQEENVLRVKLREEARTLLLQKKSAEVLSAEAMEALWPILDKHYSKPVVGEEKMINFNDFVKAGEDAGERCAQYFRAHTFAALLEKDPFGRISINTFFKYVMRREWLKQAHIGLSLYDASGQGFLRESDLETYIYELIPTMPQLKHLQAMFRPFYVCTATRKLIFFLDPMRMGKVRIIDILISGFLDDLLELREEDVPEEKLHSNWFSASSAFRVYSQFLSMDKDRNGMLSRDELASYGNGTLTSCFLDCLFQECLTFGGEMDYKMYMDFVLAMENKEQPRSLAFFFRIFDIRHKGYLDAFDLNFFFREIQEQLRQRGEEMVTFEDVKDEIYDMVKPKGSEKSHIYLDDLIACNQGKTVVSILTDIHGFCAYENRERIAADQTQDDFE